MSISESQEFGIGMIPEALWKSLLTLFNLLTPLSMQYAIRCIQDFPPVFFPRPHQLAFFTPGIFPAIAFILNGNYVVTQHQPSSFHLKPPQPPIKQKQTHPSHPKISKHASRFPPFYTPVVYLGGAGITMHLRELELGLRAGALGEGGVTDYVTEGLPVKCFSGLEETQEGEQLMVLWRGISEVGRG